MLDFTSALYLGLTHPTAALCPWEQFTTGRPAALETNGEAAAVSGALASLTRCEAATLRPSTLHVFWDLFGMIGRHCRVYLDAGAYAIARWGTERAAGRGIAVTLFPHQDASALRRAIGARGGGARPIVVADGFCAGCGRSAPIADYLSAIEDRNGLLVLDDTQALGLLGASPAFATPYGTGGGGSLRFQAIAGPQVVLIASLAKAFGVPVAMLAGSAATVRCFEAHSETRVHASPPSIAVLHAAAHALSINASAGDARRRLLAARVARFQRRLSARGISTTGGPFPSQTIDTRAVDARHLHQRLLKAGVRTVLRSVRGDGAGVTLLITARHPAAAIDCAAATINGAIRLTRT